MKKILIFLILIILVFTGCTNNSIPDLMEENIKTFEVNKIETSQKEDSSDMTEKEPQETKAVDEEITPEDDTAKEDKFARIEFYMVSGYYCRNVKQDDLEFVEMFSLDKDNFIRIAENDNEQEVFAYNYVSDDFTYIYYFDGQLISKTVFNVETGAVLQDSDGYTELLTIDAQEIKIYFYDLIEIAELKIDDLKS